MFYANGILKFEFELRVGTCAMGDSSRRQHGSQWQQSSRGWQPGSGSRDPQQGQRRQPDSASAVDRTRRELLPPAGQDIETAWRWRPRSRPASNDDGGRRRQMEYETNRSNPSAEARFPESLVLRLLWPYSVAQMNDAVRNADPNQKLWDVLCLQDRLDISEAYNLADGHRDAFFL